MMNHTLNTQHSTLNTQHSTLNTQHSTLNTQHSTLNTQHSTLNTQHSTLNTQHSTLNTQHSTLNTQHAGRGFNLIESAIVLGVVGLIIGGIWAAAASVSEDMKVSQTIAELIKIKEQTRSLFSRESYALADTQPFHQMDVASTIIAAGGSTKDPFSGTYSVNLTGQNHDSLHMNGIGIGIFYPKSACIKIVQKALGMRGLDNVIGIWSSNSAWWITPSNLTVTKTLDDIKNQVCTTSVVGLTIVFTAT